MIATKPRTIIITGASSGIGYAVAEAFLARGDNVVLNSRTPSKLSDAAQRLGHPERVALVPGDIGDRRIGVELAAVARERFGGVDVLLNNAGIFASKPLGEYVPDDLDGYLNTLRGAYYVSQASAEAMKEGDGGAIINITTVLTQRGASAIPSSAPVTAKGGLEALTASLAIELAPHNIRVNSVSPGIIRTPLHDLSEEQYDGLAGLHPLGRVGEVDDIVDAVLYLADASFVTGVILPVDGGVTAGA